MSSPISRTALQGEIDTLIERLLELRARQICTDRPIYDDSADDLRDLAKLAKDAALAVDALLKHCAFKAGLSTVVGVVSRAVEDELLAEINCRIEKLEEERGGEPQSAIDRRENSTLGHAHLGLQR